MTNTYFKKSRKEEKQRILKREMLSNLKEAKATHKKNKSEANMKSHLRNFSLLENNQKKHTRKVSRRDGTGAVRKDEDFFEF